MISNVITKAVLPEKTLGLKEFINKKAAKEGKTVEELFTEAAEELKSGSIPKEDMEKAVNFASMLRIAAADQNMIAEGMKKNGVDNVELLKVAVSGIGLEVFFKDLLAGKGVANSMVLDTLSCTAVLPENELKVKPFLEEMAGGQGTTVEKLLDSLAKKLVKPVNPNDPETDQLINTASVIRVDEVDQQLVANALTRSGVTNQKLIQYGVAIASVGAFTAPILGSFPF